MEASTADATMNGHAQPSPRERIALDLEAVLEQLRAQRELLRTELDSVSADIKAFEQSLARLRGEPLINHPGAKRGPGRPPKKQESHGTGISEERLGQVRDAILRYAVDHEEFTQVEIRTLPDAPLANSGSTAAAFEKLRQAGVIRFARKDGNRKFFRLTSESLRELEQRES